LAAAAATSANSKQRFDDEKISDMRLPAERMDNAKGLLRFRRRK
jgi:hypothetical protein